MIKAISEIYNSIVANSQEKLSDLVNDSDALVKFSKSHNYITDFEKMADAIASRPEGQILLFASREYEHSLYSVSTGMYRHAYLSLRLFFELGLSSVYFSAYEIKLRRWLKGEEDIFWSALIDPETGVFSNNYIGAFFPEMCPHVKQYRALAEKVYRECSEFVHGNMNTQAEPGLRGRYDRSSVEAWVDRAESIRICLLFAFVSRYINILDRDCVQKLEFVALDGLGHLSAVREVYS